MGQYRDHNTGDYHVERRQGIRKRAPGNIVYMYYRGKKMHTARTRNISTKGVFLETNSLGVPLGAVIMLVFQINDGNITKLHRKSSVVTRVSDDGCGCGFIQSRRRVAG